VSRTQNYPVSLSPFRFVLTPSASIIFFRTTLNVAGSIPSANLAASYSSIHSGETSDSHTPSTGSLVSSLKTIGFSFVRKPFRSMALRTRTNIGFPDLDFGR
jgi:hypothetical protein